MPVKKIINKGKVPVKIFTDDIDPKAIDQLCNIAQLDIVHSHVAAMPDVHLGKGATVGSVIPTYKAIIPAAVGVDIGCGMNAVRLSVKASQLPDSLKKIRELIEGKVPVGFNMHAYARAKNSTIQSLDKGIDVIVSKHKGIMKMASKNFAGTWKKQLGTLGGGNHFIELCIDENQDVWVMLHSGSRGVGNIIGRYFISRAQKDMQRHQIHLPDKDLAYFREGSEYFDDYVEAVNWAQDYAMTNRRVMMQLILDVLKQDFPEFTATKEAVNCHHNYVSMEHHFGKDVFVTRKGAIRAGKGELGIIPGSMGTKSFIVRGLGNEESFCSCSHGAGRVMSRTKAKRTFSREDLVQQTQGIECRKDTGVIDEIPAAYKDIDVVMNNQSDLVEIVHTLRQVVCVKG